MHEEQRSDNDMGGLVCHAGSDQLEDDNGEQTKLSE